MDKIKEQIRNSNIYNPTIYVIDVEYLAHIREEHVIKVVYIVTKFNKCDFTQDEIKQVEDSSGEALIPCTNIHRSAFNGSLQVITCYDIANAILNPYGSVIEAFDANIEDIGCDHPAYAYTFVINKVHDKEEDDLDICIRHENNIFIFNSFNLNSVKNYGDDWKIFTTKPIGFQTYVDLNQDFYDVMQ